MTKMETNLVCRKSKGLVVLEYVILALCLCIMALRATVIEMPVVQSLNQLNNPGNNIYSLTISAVLTGLLVIWLAWSFCCKRVIYRVTWVEPGLCVFIIAAVIAGLSAANKRAALDSFQMLLAPILMVVMLVQILDSKARVKVVLVCVAALGVVGAYQCSEQFFYTNKMMIQQYQQNPPAMLEPLGIAYNSFDHMLFEHRLFSQGVHGFFTTSNSAGSFALLASFAAIVLFVNVLRNRKSDTSWAARAVVAGAAGFVVVFGLLITRSKGAIIGFLAAMCMFGGYLLFGSFLRRHRKTLVVFCLLLAVAGGIVVVGYGSMKHRLPGGNSMLVRWQYWRASAQMCADKALTGVGPGNFVHYYPRYKTPGALETVADPHNFLLSILTQYGPLGLLGFLGIILVPLWKVVFATAPVAPKAGDSGILAYRRIVVAFGVVICLGLLVLRPMVLKIPATASFVEKQAAAVMLYVLVTAVFAVGFACFAFAGDVKGIGQGEIVVAGLFCGVIGLLIHNLVDFAIFEPGVLTAFSALLACLIGLHLQGIGRKAVVWKPGAGVRAGVIICAAGVLWWALAYGLVPTAKSVAKIKEARRAVAYRRFEAAHELLGDAAEDDRLNPAIASMDAQVYLNQYRSGGKTDEKLLFEAERNLLEAVRRNSIDYKNYERLAEVYGLLGEAAGSRQREYLSKAFKNAAAAAERYPGSGRLAFAAGESAERLGLAGKALGYYRQAIRIEDAYRRQFRLMYPGREIFSRLGEGKYEAAKQRVRELSGEEN